MITEELGEFLEGALKGDIEEGVDAICDVTVFGVGEIYKYDELAEKWLGYGDIADWMPNTMYEAQFSYIEEVTYLLYQFLEADMVIDRVQAISNIVIVSYRELLAMNYDPDLAMAEVMKEINSRVGEYSKVSKKWQKDKSPEAKAKWYKADFSDCLLAV